MQHPWVILFDIDGTLLTVDSSFNRPLLSSIISGLGINYSGVETDSFSGRTDHDILSSFLENHEADQSLYQQLKQIYLERLATELQTKHIIRHHFVDEAIYHFFQ
jgi:phosphoglycolate phosphatase